MSATPDYGKPIPVRLDPDLLAKIEALAVKLGEPKSTVMRICMRIGVKAVAEFADRDPIGLITGDQAPRDEGQQSFAAERHQSAPVKSSLPPSPVPSGVVAASKKVRYSKTKAKGPRFRVIDAPADSSGT